MKPNQETPSHKAFQTSGHTEQYDAISKYCPALLQVYYRCFNDVLELTSILDYSPNKDILELGCASGEISRYLKLRHLGSSYRGRDISHQSTELAKKNILMQIFLL